MSITMVIYEGQVVCGEFRHESAARTPGLFVTAVFCFRVRLRVIGWTFIVQSCAKAPLHLQVSDATLRRIFNEMDCDRSGKIDRKEFVKWLATGNLALIITRVTVCMSAQTTSEPSLPPRSKRAIMQAGSEFYIGRAKTQAPHLRDAGVAGDQAKTI
jgi:hypothetical protein